ncbi:hypothetical protein L207DRAFT_520014 [Hyaloscypha variabilis F]|uniref:Uncharacterized protein n=1 Tax=Hyaloscypha variabilis (strain UAMH 11265 / GT02V1 / F) TaxID=1149755 RepID=A0A2J6QR93_HYAVF|nr:hypothetical protein L207DRAFT_521390 [Hyaloscypha variabilis F]PMD30507.1 hypothetical protein L207DRAFT_520014 [Hyaloscypha variabilis F]
MPIMVETVVASGFEPRQPAQTARRRVRALVETNPIPTDAGRVCTENLAPRFRLQFIHPDTIV